jgi:hypothetical protein
MHCDFDKNTVKFRYLQNGDLYLEEESNEYAHTMGVMNFEDFIRNSLNREPGETKHDSVVVFGRDLLELAKYLGIRALAKRGDAQEVKHKKPEFLQLGISEDFNPEGVNVLEEKAIKIKYRA